MKKGERRPRLKAVVMKVDSGSRGWALVEKTFQVMITLCGTTQALENFWRENRRVLDMLKGEDLEAYNRVLESFKLRKTEILNAGGMVQDNAKSIHENQDGDSGIGDADNDSTIR